jgi:hypothetical protein
MFTLLQGFGNGDRSKVAGKERQMTLYVLTKTLRSLMRVRRSQ